MTAVLEAMMCDCRPVFIEFFLLQDVVSCCVVGGSCDSSWLAGDWSLDLSSCEVGEFASQAKAGSPGAQHLMLHMSLPFTCNWNPTNE